MALALACLAVFSWPLFLFLIPIIICILFPRLRLLLLLLLLLLLQGVPNKTGFGRAWPTPSSALCAT